MIGVAPDMVGSKNINKTLPGADEVDCCRLIRNKIAHSTASVGSKSSLRKKHMEAGRRVVYADVQDIDMWEELDMSKVEAAIVSMSSNIELKKHIVKLIRTKNKFEREIFVLTLNEREDEQILQFDAKPVSVPSVQIGERMADLGMGKNPA